MYGNKKKISIFIDTNVLQVFYENKNVCLHEIRVPNEYYNLTRFIIANKLENYVEICIPNMVALEYKQHMLNCFDIGIKQLDQEVADYKKIFGFLIEISVDKKVDKEQYSDYVDSLFQAFVDNPRNLCKVVPYTNSAELIDILLKKALSGIKPFYVGKIGGKVHSDAGFKDAIIAETIYKYCEINGRIGGFISNDNDFSDLFNRMLDNENDYVLFNSFDSAIQALEKYYEINTFTQLKNRIENDGYLHERLLNEIGVVYDKTLTTCIVCDVEQETDNIYAIDVDFIVNETKYHFIIKFDDNANDFIDLKYSIEDD